MTLLELLRRMRKLANKFRSSDPLLAEDIEDCDIHPQDVCEYCADQVDRLVSLFVRERLEEDLKLAVHDEIELPEGSTEDIVFLAEEYMRASAPIGEWNDIGFLPLSNATPVNWKKEEP